MEYLLQPLQLEHVMFRLLLVGWGLVEALVEKGRADVEEVAGTWGE